MNPEVAGPSIRFAPGARQSVSARERSSPARLRIVSARTLAVTCASARPLALASTGTNAIFKHCAIVIISCWSFPFAPPLTSHTLLPGKLDATLTASYRARAAQESRTAGSILQSRAGRSLRRLQGLRGGRHHAGRRSAIALARSLRRKSLQQIRLGGSGGGGQGHSPWWSGLPLPPSPDWRVCDLNHGGL